jgi:hypothetical protein
MSKQQKVNGSLSEEDLNANVKKLKTQNLNFQVAFTFTFLKKHTIFKSHGESRLSQAHTIIKS